MGCRAIALQQVRRDLPLLRCNEAKKPAAGVAESGAESCFSKPPESGFADLEKW
jgi:hypothetical protein